MPDIPTLQRPSSREEPTAWWRESASGMHLGGSLNLGPLFGSPNYPFPGLKTLEWVPPDTTGPESKIELTGR